jgi:hypothetical protein
MRMTTSWHMLYVLMSSYDSDAEDIYVASMLTSHRTNYRYSELCDRSCYKYAQLACELLPV